MAFNLGQKLIAQQKQHATILVLTGPLGAGKTTFTQGLAQGLGITDKIISPTFIIMRQHPVPHTPKILYHLDLYRLSAQQSLHELGLSELFTDPNNIVVIEWSEKISDQLPPYTLKINFKITDSGRTIEITEPELG